MRRTITSLLLAVCFAAALSGAARADTYYVYNYWGDGTWHDANKIGGDTNYCWAASAANILDWAGWGTSAYSTESSIYAYIKSYWSNNGSLPEYAWQWWLNGTSPPQWPGWSQLTQSGGGDFWSGVIFDNYYSYAMGRNLLAKVDNYFDLGYGVVLGIYRRIGNTTYGHALTCWGYDYTASGNGILYTGIWVTDSDDGVTVLKYYALLYSSIGLYYLDDYSGSDSWYIGVVEALGQNHAPLPPSLLLFGSGLLGLVGWRRYRKGKPRSLR